MPVTLAPFLFAGAAPLAADIQLTCQNGRLSLTATDATVRHNGPYYATPSWDQKLDPSVRFIVLANWNNEAVLDRETGIVWQLPTLQEFMSIIDTTLWGNFANRVAPLVAGHPFLGVTDHGSYWTATTNDQQQDHAFFVLWTPPATTPPDLIYSVASSDKTAAGGHAWCVRGGLQPAAQ